MSQLGGDPTPGPQSREAAVQQMAGGGGEGQRGVSPWWDRPQCLGLRGAGLRFKAYTSLSSPALFTPPAANREEAGHRDTGRGGW